MRKLDIDIETFSTLDLRQVGVYRYVEEPTTEVLILCWSVDGGPVHRWTYYDALLPTELIQIANDPDTQVWAHNAEFERVVLNGRPGKRIGWPHVPLRRWYDTQAVAAALALPLALDGTAAALGLGETKDKRGKYLIQKFCKPRRPSKHDARTRWGKDNALKDWEDFVDYCDQDVVVLTEVRKALHKIRKLPKKEWALWRRTIRMHETGIPFDVATIRKARRLCADYAEKLHKKTCTITGGIRVTQRDKIMAWLKERGCELENMQAKTITDTLAMKIPKKVRKVLLLRQELSKTSIKKLDKMLMCVCKDGRIHGTLQYHGATTGRYAGRLVQPQNFPRGTLKLEDIEKGIAAIKALDMKALAKVGNPMVVVSSCLRAMIKAPPGKRIFAGDYSSIEARGVCWLAGQEDVLDEYRRGLDAYVVMATVIFAVPMASVNAVKRKLGKDTVLGCGFQMGHETFRQQIIDRGGDDVGEALAKKAVDAYRKKHKKVKRLWSDMNTRALMAMDNPDRWVSVNPRLKFCYTKDFLWMRLPSGRLLAYPYPDVRMVKKWGKMRRQITFMGMGLNNKWIRISTYGGKLTENATQALARDLMIAGLHSVDDAGYEIITQVHDELVNLHYKDGGDTEELEEVMCNLPDWAAGFPLAAGAYRAQRYRKD